MGELVIIPGMARKKVGELTVQLTKECTGGGITVMGFTDASLCSFSLSWEVLQDIIGKYATVTPIREDDEKAEEPKKTWKVNITDVLRPWITMDMAPLISRIRSEYEAQDAAVQWAKVKCMQTEPYLNWSWAYRESRAIEIYDNAHRVQYRLTWSEE